MHASVCSHYGLPSPLLESDVLIRSDRCGAVKLGIISSKTIPWNSVSILEYVIVS